MKIINSIVVKCSAIIIGTLCLTSVANAGLLINEDFETGDLSGWTTFLTANGTASPTVSSFDTTGSGASLAAQFQVGEANFAGLGGGGGIFQSINLAAGNFTLSVDVAAAANQVFDNASGGIFELLFDNLVVDSFDSAFITAGSVERDLLSTVNVASAGLHEVRIRMTRPFEVGDTPLQYIDNVILNAVSVPEPAGLALLGLGLAGLGLARKKIKT